MGGVHEKIMFKVLNNYVELVNGHRDGILSMMSEFKNSSFMSHIFFFKNGTKLFKVLKTAYMYLHVLSAKQHKICILL